MRFVFQYGNRYILVVKGDWWMMMLCTYGNVLNGTYCAYVENKVTTDGGTGEPVIENDVSNEVSVIKCRGDKEFCYTLWYINPHDKMHHTVFMQGN